MINIKLLYQQILEQKTSGSFKSSLPDNYWNDDRLKKLEKGYNASMSRKEMVQIGRAHV